MKDTLVLVLGDQLLKNHPLLEKEQNWAMIESKDFNSEFKYNKQRILHCFVSMREYCNYLESVGKDVEYINIQKEISIKQGFEKWSKEYKKIKMLAIDDKGFMKYVLKLSKECSIELEFLPSPKFVTKHQDWLNFKEQYPIKLLQNDFYVFNRKRLNILVTKDQKSIYGKWSLDADNKQKLPESVEIPTTVKNYTSFHLESVQKEIETYFKDHPGYADELYYPCNFEQAEMYWQKYLDNGLSNFGPYQDSITNRDPFLFHSLTSPLLNTGLLDVNELLQDVINSNIIDNSKEGFIRQVIGWREWMNCLYWNVYQDDLKQYNNFKASNPLPGYFWNEELLEEISDNTPLYNALKKVFKYSYNHHIERLMIIANWMTLNEYDPVECYNWFMTMYIDSYSWVMVGNVFGMGLYADGGIFSTKPYISGGNYLKKMSDYKDWANWEKQWTDKFWYFLLRNKDELKSNPRLNMLISSKLKNLDL